MKKIFLFLLLIFQIPFLFGHDNSALNEITGEEYFENYVVKINDSNQKLKIANRKNHFERIGTETVQGDVSGTLYYTVKIKGLKAVVIFRYTNYSVQEGWTFDGELAITSDINQNGTYSGTITVSGECPATVCYDNIRLGGGKPSSGDFLILMNEKIEIVPYSLFIEICEANGIEI